MCLSAWERVGTAQGKRETRGDGNEGFECLFNLPFPSSSSVFLPRRGQPPIHPGRHHSALVRARRRPIDLVPSSCPRPRPRLRRRGPRGTITVRPPSISIAAAPCCTPDFPDCSTSGRGAGASSLKSAGCMIAVDNWTATAPSLWPPSESQLPPRPPPLPPPPRPPRSPGTPKPLVLEPAVCLTLGPRESRRAPPLGPANRPRFLGSGRCCNTVM